MSMNRQTDHVGGMQLSLPYNGDEEEDKQNMDIRPNQGITTVAADIAQVQWEIMKRLGRDYFQHFRPAEILLNSHNNSGSQQRNTSTHAGFHHLPMDYCASPNYMGDLSLPSNRSALIPEEQNCSLWITGLPPNIDHHNLLGAIRGVGKIYATVINPPLGIHSTSAAKVVFFEREQAETLFLQIVSGNFIVMGQRLCRGNVRWNNIKSARYPHSDQSRSIRITGVKQWMNFEFFDHFFRQRFAFELDTVTEVACDMIGCASQDWHFGSLRCQAASAKLAIEREMTGIFLVSWIQDPCQ